MATLDVGTVPDDGHSWIALVDDADFERLSRWRWALSTGPRPVPVRFLRLPGRPPATQTLAREVMGLLPGDPRVVRRVDRRGFDFTRANLRIVTPRPGARVDRVESDRYAPGRELLRPSPDS